MSLVRLETCSGVFNKLSDYFPNLSNQDIKQITHHVYVTYFQNLITKYALRESENTMLR